MGNTVDERDQISDDKDQQQSDSSVSQTPQAEPGSNPESSSDGDGDQ